jgi:hypothetical protein
MLLKNTDRLSDTSARMSMPRAVKEGRWKNTAEHSQTMNRV